ncbi:Increased dna methylation, partial [Thalictrum thalictroides]
DLVFDDDQDFVIATNWEEGFALVEESEKGRMDVPTIARGQLLDTIADDQRFLLNFITGYYLGADVVTDIPRRAISQRVREGLPPYKSTDLGSSVLTLHQLEHLYGYIWKDAHPSVGLKEPSLHRYFNNKLPPPKSGLLGDARQFHSFFPIEKHLQKIHGRNPKTFNGIIIIDDPDTSHIEAIVLERFKLLTHRNEVRINLEDFEVYCTAKKEERNEKNLKRRQDSANNGKGKKRARPTEPPLFVEPIQMRPLYVSHPAICWKNTAEADNVGGPEGDSQPSIVYTGTAEGEILGPPIGQFDIGTTEHFYFCRVSLPGVSSAEDAMECIVERGGRVTIKGLTMTGEDYVCKGSQMFEMTKRLPSSGIFSISFNLPGRVENRNYNCSLKDGLLEFVSQRWLKAFRSDRGFRTEA